MPGAALYRMGSGPLFIQEARVAKKEVPYDPIEAAKMSVMGPDPQPPDWVAPPPIKAFPVEVPPARRCRVREDRLVSLGGNYVKLRAGDWMTDSGHGREVVDRLLETGILGPPEKE